MNQEMSSTVASDSLPPVADPQNDPRPAGRKMVLRLAALIAASLALLIIGLPTIVATTGLYNAILERAAEGRELSVTAGSATLAWFSPVSFRNADVKRDDQSWSVSTETFSTDRTLMQFLLTPSDIGTINLDQPVVILRPVDSIESKVEDDGSAKKKTIYPSFRAVVRDAAVELRTAENSEPVITIDAISFVGRTEVSNKTSMLIVEPVKLFDRRDLTPELCAQGLQLIAPFLSEAAMVTGQLTVEMDQFQIPIGTVTHDERVQLTKIDGRMMLHRVETGLKNPILAEIASVLATMSGGRFGMVRAAEESEVRFRVADGRVHHDGLTLLIPELAHDLTIRTSGWVDLNENIDIQILVNVSGLASSRIELLSSLMQAPLEVRMTGTLRHPRISLPGGQNMLDQLKGRFSGLAGGGNSARGNGQTNLTGAINDLVGGLVGDPEKKPDVPRTARGIFDLIEVFRDKSDADRLSVPGRD